MRSATWLLTRRKLRRFSTGKASHRRIKSISARSLSLRSAAKVRERLARLAVFFTQRFLQNFEHCFITRSSCGPFAGDDVGQIPN
jgi:hypothetical protein